MRSFMSSLNRSSSEGELTSTGTFRTPNNTGYTVSTNSSSTVAYFPSKYGTRLSSDSSDTVPKEKYRCVPKALEAKMKVGDAPNAKQIKKVKGLVKHLKTMDKKCEKLQLENRRLDDELINEKLKSSKLGDKIQFIKDNQELFVRLKQAYINMKYNESTLGKRMIEINEQGCQTWVGSIDEEFSVRDMLEKQSLELKLSLALSEEQYQNMAETVANVKQVIEERYASRDHELDQMRTRINALENENECLRNIVMNREELIGKRVATTQYTLQEEVKVKDKQNPEVELLQSIIVKLGRKFCEQYPKACPNNVNSSKKPLLNKTEREILRTLMTKYLEQSRSTRHHSPSDHNISSESRLEISQGKDDDFYLQ